MTAEHEDDSSEPTLDKRRRSVVQRCVEALITEKPEYYYEPAAELAREIHATIRRPGFLNEDDQEAVLPLKIRDIEVLLSYK